MATAAPALAVPHANIPTDKADRDAFVVKHLPLVGVIAAGIRDRLPVQVTLDDLIQEGTIGLLAAIETYDPRRGVGFRTYAKHRIRGTILDSLRQLNFVSRDTRRHAKRIEAATRQLAQSLGRAPTETELCGALGLTVERFHQINSRVCQTAALFEENDNVPNTRGTSHLPDQRSAAAETRALLEGAIDSLPPRYQTVIRSYYFEDLNMREVSGLLGVNESRVSQIHKVAMGRLRTALKARGIPNFDQILPAA